MREGDIPEKCKKEGEKGRNFRGWVLIVFDSKKLQFDDAIISYDSHKLFVFFFILLN